MLYIEAQAVNDVNLFPESQDGIAVFIVLVVSSNLNIVFL